MSKARGPNSPTAVTVAISTMGPRVSDVQLPAPEAGLRYLLLVQAPPEPVPRFERSDVQVVALPGRGLSNSRNSALELTETPYLLFADDDLLLYPDGIRALAEALDGDPELDMAVGWRARAGGLPPAHRLRRLNAGHVCVPELMVRCAAVRAAGVAFDPAFGVGARHPIGEDFIFVCDLLAAGRKGLCLPVSPGAHPGRSTGDAWADPEILQARKAVLRRAFGLWAGPVRALYGLKHRKRLGGWRGALAFAWLG